MLLTIRNAPIRAPNPAGDVLLVHGPAGVGKTNVVLTALEAAREDLTVEQMRQTYLLAPTLSALILALDGTPVNDNDVFEKDDVYVGMVDRCACL